MPSAFVVRSDLVPIPTLVTTTLAPAITEPLGSVTLPVMVPFVSCDQTVPAASRHRMAISELMRLGIQIFPFSKNVKARRKHTSACCFLAESARNHLSTPFSTKVELIVFGSSGIVQAKQGYIALFCYTKLKVNVK